MFETVQVVAGDEDVSAGGIFGLGVVGGVGDEDGFGLQARLEFGVILADKTKLVAVTDFVGIAGDSGEAFDSGNSVGGDGRTESAASEFWGGVCE
ncbi:MAG: hypothetical protein LBG65_07305 [Puniceicoccales bacterium]|nr:hypothetical protein [Puniceicoccales bacterium]